MLFLSSSSCFTLLCLQSVVGKWVDGVWVFNLPALLADSDWHSRASWPKEGYWSYKSWHQPVPGGTSGLVRWVRLGEPVLRWGAWQRQYIAQIHGINSHCSLSCSQTVPGSPALRAGFYLRASVTTFLQAPSHGMKPGSSAKRITLT